MKFARTALQTILLMSALPLVIDHPALAQVSLRMKGADIALQNQAVTVVYHTHTGKMDIEWRNGNELIGVESGAQLADGRLLNTADYPVHELVKQSQRAEAGNVRGFTMRSTAPGKPALLQHVIMSDVQPWISIQAELDREASTVGTRHFDAVILKGTDSIQISRAAALRL